jgi:hypothetical protein
MKHCHCLGAAKKANTRYMSQRPFAYSNNQYLFALYFYVDDKEVGWNPPSDNDGKIYATVRRWTTDLQDTPPTYDQAEHFLRFLDKYYVSHAVGNHYLLQWSKSNWPKTFLDKVTTLDIAYTILVYENSKEVWEDELQIRVNSKTDDERKKAMQKQNPSIMKEGESNYRGTEMAGQTMDESTTKNC